MGSVSIFIILTVNFVILIGSYYFVKKLINDIKQTQALNSDNLDLKLKNYLTELSAKINQDQANHNEKQHQAQLNLHKVLHDSLNTFNQQTQTKLSQEFQQQYQHTEKHLLEITQTVNQQLSKGFEKTGETFTNIIKRLALIDDAQQKITELSKNVINLKSILDDKRSRGAFGEMQLANLIHNLLPKSSYKLQHSFSTGARVDCCLFLPPPTGNIAIDAKFPLENFQKYIQAPLNSPIGEQAKNQFKLDIKKHITDIKDKYIIPNETSDGAIMFIPAEAVFAEIHANFPDLVSYAHQAKVWLVSPSTLMAVLTTASAVIKDAATQKQIHLIQQHLGLLAKDFLRFEKRMNNLTKHINQANLDAEQINVSAQKITKRFNQIEQVELPESKLALRSKTDELENTGAL